MIQEADTDAYVQQTVKQPVPEEPDTLAWFEAFSSFWVLGIVPVIIAILGYKSLKLKVQKHNAERRKKYHQEGRDQDFIEDTTLDYFRKMRE